MKRKMTSSSFLYKLHRYTVTKNIMALFYNVFDSLIYLHTGHSGLDMDQS